MAVQERIGDGGRMIGAEKGVDDGVEGRMRGSNTGLRGVNVVGGNATGRE